MQQKSDKKRRQGADGPKKPASPTPRRIDLSTLRDVRLELAAVYRKVDAGEIASQDGTRRAYMLGRLGDMIALADLEQRIVELESLHGVPGEVRPQPEHRTLN